MHPSSAYVNCLVKRTLVKCGVWNAGTKWVEGSGLWASVPSNFGSSHGYGSEEPSPDAMRPISLSSLCASAWPPVSLGSYPLPPQGFPLHFFLALSTSRFCSIPLPITEIYLQACLPEASHPGCRQVRVFEHSSLFEFRKREQNMKCCKLKLFRIGALRIQAVAVCN